jgi:hypothetical protein
MAVEFHPQLSQAFHRKVSQPKRSKSTPQLAENGSRFDENHLAKCGMKFNKLATPLCGANGNPS